jgi:hypothetical protein
MEAVPLKASTMVLLFHPIKHRVSRFTSQNSSLSVRSYMPIAKARSRTVFWAVAGALPAPNCSGVARFDRLRSVFACSKAVKDCDLRARKESERSHHKSMLTVKLGSVIKLVCAESSNQHDHWLFQRGKQYTKSCGQAAIAW